MNRSYFSDDSSSAELSGLLVSSVPVSSDDDSLSEELELSLTSAAEVASDTDSQENISFLPFFS